VRSVRTVWPENLPLLARISATDWVNGGWDLEQSVELVQQLLPLGVDLIDCSSGGTDPQDRQTWSSSPGNCSVTPTGRTEPLVNSDKRPHGRHSISVWLQPTLRHICKKVELIADRGKLRGQQANS
jgi:2,4-dienoyl-CoA reductase-like NADH-dependent reductase (Old Yellow Enzyme family)